MFDVLDPNEQEQIHAPEHVKAAIEAPVAETIDQFVQAAIDGKPQRFNLEWGNAYLVPLSEGRLYVYVDFAFGGVTTQPEEVRKFLVHHTSNP